MQGRKASQQKQQESFPSNQGMGFIGGFIDKLTGATQEMYRTQLEDQRLTRQYNMDYADKQAQNSWQNYQACIKDPNCDPSTFKIKDPIASRCKERCDELFQDFRFWESQKKAPFQPQEQQYKGEYGLNNQEGLSLQDILTNIKQMNSNDNITRAVISEEVSTVQEIVASIKEQDGSKLIIVNPEGKGSKFNQEIKSLKLEIDTTQKIDFVLANVQQDSSTCGDHCLWMLKGVRDNTEGVSYKSGILEVSNKYGIHAVAYFIVEESQATVMQQAIKQVIKSYESKATSQEILEAVVNHDVIFLLDQKLQVQLEYVLNGGTEVFETLQYAMGEQNPVITFEDTETINNDEYFMLNGYANEAANVPLFLGFSML